MFAAVGAPVVRLHRASYGPVSLSQLQLAPGTGVWLSDEVVATLYEAASLGAPSTVLSVSLSPPGSGDGS